MKSINRVSGGKVHIWMNLIGFERDDEDKGAIRFLNQTGFVPDGACALLFHPDFIHHHNGMDEEYELHPDNCAYYAVPRNAEKERQKWTNYDLRKLCKNLNAVGCGLYAGIMGCTLDNMFHEEWIQDHPEIYTHYRGGVRENHCILKRFSDGSYYEDFFIDKLCGVLSDYGMRGVHFSDCFCPSGYTIAHGDFSTDLVTQFLDMTGCTLDESIVAELGDDSAETEDRRSDWIWKNLREQWIEFLCTRWENFFTKLCKRVHAIGCEVMILGMYCTDPFETKYCMGMDLARLVNAGVDYITENILPSSVFFEATKKREEKEYKFQQYMAIVPMMAAHVRGGHLLTMLGTYDAAEEWDMLHHVPHMHEKDIYATMAYRLETSHGSQRALEGYFVCLGDGIGRSDWDLERKRFEIAMSADVDRTLSPVMLWSDTSYNKLLREYISTRRWTPFKLFYELGKAGTMLGGCVRSEDLTSFSGTLVVGDFDMLSDEEKKAVVSYNRGPVLIVMKAEYDIGNLRPEGAYEFIDGFSAHPLKAYLFNTSLDEAVYADVQNMLGTDDGTSDFVGNPSDMNDSGNPLYETLPFTKVNGGFVKALAFALKASSTELVECDVPCLVYKLSNGNLRIYLFNDMREQYNRAFVKIKCNVKDTNVVSSFPLLPVRYKADATGGIRHNYDCQPENKQSFEVKLAPGGASIVDVIIDL